MEPRGYFHRHHRSALCAFVVLLAGTATLALASDRDEATELVHERAKRWASATPPAGIAKLAALDVICGKDHMTVRAEFNGPFQGIVFSKGTYGQDNCVYVKPYSSTTHSTFKVYYDQCGTKPDLQGKYYENTIVIQYGTDIIEAWDEAKRLRCEWFEAYEKPATFRPAIPVADLDVVEMNFQGDDIDCWMEIQEGKGPWAREVNRIVPVGQPMTIVVSINDYNGHFDMRVKSCFAHDGVKPPIHLTDEHGCVLRPKMLTSFNKVREGNGKATVISYSHFYAFKFPDTMNVQIQCTVEVCRHGCPDACQKGPYPTPVREITSKVQLSSGPAPSPRNPSHQPPKHDDEPAPVYQEVSGSRPSPVRLPGINDAEVAHHATRFLEAQGVDVSKLRGGIEKGGEESQHNFHVSHPSGFGSASHHILGQAGPGAEIELLEDESKPVVKVVEIDVPEDKKKPATISENAPLFPGDLDQASQLLSNLGLNVNLGTFAQDFLKNMQNKEIADLLANERIKELAAASGVKFNPADLAAAASAAGLPEAQPLINGSLSSEISAEEPTTTFRPSAPLQEPQPTGAQQQAADQNKQQQQHQQQQQQQAPQQAHHGQNVYPHPVHHPQEQHQQRPHHPQQPFFHQGPPPPGFNPPGLRLPPGVRPSQEVLQKLHQQQMNAQHNPVVQVLNIPMQPGLSPGAQQQFPPAFTNFVHHPQPHQKPNRPLFFGGFSLPQLPQLRLPSIFGGNHDRAASPDQRKDQSQGTIASGRESGPQAPSTTGPGGVTARPGVFPQGPRSMRQRRAVSQESEISVNKRFQVVTAIDLAFFPNATTDLPQVFEGRREEVVYGVCMPLMGFAAAISCILCVITCALAFSVAAVYRLNKLKAARKSAACS